jgi:Icc-related predicted phosphoesterase
VIRVAAAGDLHYGLDSAGLFRPALQELRGKADVFLMAGDLTKLGSVAEAEVLAEELRDSPVPVVTVLGNHDYHSNQQAAVRGVLEQAGVRVVEGETAVFEVEGRTVGVAGVKGFCGGFAGACATDFGEPEMKGFITETRRAADRLREALSQLSTDIRVALMHYSPVKETLHGEPPEIYAFLGSYLLAEAVDCEGADIVLHGHAHRGAEHGVTPGGIPVRNVAQPVINRPYRVFVFDEGRAGSAESAA